MTPKLLLFGEARPRAGLVERSAMARRMSATDMASMRASKLSGTDHCLASFGINPRPVKAAYEQFMGPLEKQFKEAWTVVDYKFYEAKCRMTGEKVVEARVRNAFLYFDGDGSGNIDVHELKLALRKLGFDVDLAAAEAILNRYDDNDNGDMEMDEFNEMVLAFEQVTNMRVEDAHLNQGLDDDRNEKTRRLAKARQAAKRATRSRCADAQAALPPCRPAALSP